MRRNEWDLLLRLSIAAAVIAQWDKRVMFHSHIHTTIIFFFVQYDITIDILILVLSFSFMVS